MRKLRAIKHVVLAFALLPLILLADTNKTAQGACASPTPGSYKCNIYEPYDCNELCSAHCDKEDPSISYDILTCVEQQSGVGCVIADQLCTQLAECKQSSFSCIGGKWCQFDFWREEHTIVSVAFPTTTTCP